MTYAFPAPVIEVARYGAKGDNSTNDQLAIQAANDAAEAAGGGIVTYLPGKTYRITDRILVDTSRVSHRSMGVGSSATIRQATWEKPVFEVRGADDVTISDLKLVSTQTRAVIPGAFEGEAARDYCSGAYVINCNRFTMQNVSVDGLVDGVYLRGTTAAPSTLYVDNSVLNCRFTTCDQGILAHHQERLRVEGITASLVNSQGTGPTHLFYITGLVNSRCQDVQLSNVICYGADGQAVQVKFTDGLNASNILAHDCGGALNLLDVKGGTIRGIVSLADITANASVFCQDACEGLVLSDIFVEQVSGAAGYGMFTDLDTSDIEINNIFVRHYDTGLGARCVRIDGTRNRLTNVKVDSLSARGRAVVFYQSTDCELDGLSTVNQQYDVEMLDATAVGTVIRFDPQRLSGNTGAVLDVGTSTRIIRGEAFQTITYQTPTTNTEAAKGRVCKLAVTNNTNFTIANPTSVSPGMELVYDIYNNVGGAMGTITWGAAFLLAGAFVNPANTKHRTISFCYDGTNWVETNRAAADI